MTDKKKHYYSYNPQISMVFFIDYLPILIAKSSVAAHLYFIYYKCMNKTRIFEMRYKDLSEQFGFAISSIVKANKLLSMLKLIEPTKKLKKNGTEIVRIELLEPEPIEEIKRTQIYNRYDLTLDTVFRTAFANKAAPKFKRALKVIEIQETRAYLDKYNEAMAISSSDWKAAHLLSYFLIRYEERYNCEYSFPNEKAIWSGKQIKDMSRVIGRFKGNATNAKEYMDWVFDVKSYDERLDGLERTGLLAHQNMIQEYRRHSANKGKSRTTNKVSEDRLGVRLNSGFIDWVNESFPDFGYPLRTKRDLMYLKQIGAKHDDESIKTVMKEAEKRGLIK